MTASYSSPYREKLKVRFRDTDSQGHMFFANYLVFADEVAGNYMRTLGFDWSDHYSMPTYVFTANATCDYVRECHEPTAVPETVREALQADGGDPTHAARRA